MEDKYSINTQKEINSINKYLEQWRTLLCIEKNYYAEGWAISLREKTIYPRYIVIFKPYNQNKYLIKSFEIHYNKNGKEYFKDLYFIDTISSMNELFREIKNVFYGKDIINSIKKDNSNS